MAVHEEALTATGEPAEGGALHYVVVWAVLVGLTILTWLLGKVHLGALSLPVALLIAVFLIKTSLILVFIIRT
mgnify:CR=1 FL=1